MAANARDKFDAAVKVIQSLPKNVSSIDLGSFQPSNELLLKFYAYYKQATVGPCATQRPAFWDVVGKAKWEAWNKLGSMPAEQAMLNYVDELKKIMRKRFGGHLSKDSIVEAMPHTTMVSEFVEKLGTFYEMVDDTGASSPRKRKPGSDPERITDASIPASPNGDVTATSSTTAAAIRDGSPVPRVNGHGKTENGYQPDSSDSSESAAASPDHSPAHVADVVPVSKDNQVIMTSVAVKATPAGDPPPDPTPSPDKQNGVDEANSDSGEEESEGLTDSEAEEFLDTSDLPDHREPELLSVSQSSTPDITSTRIITTATVHHPIEPDDSSPTDSPQHATFMLGNQPISDMVTCRGGGDSGGDRPAPDLPRAGSSNSMSSSGRGGSQRGAAQHGRLLTAGGSGGGGREPGAGSSSQRFEVNEQIAVALVRLQQDMSSVLSRLNTLEALTLAQHQMQRSRQNSESDRPLRQPAQRAERPWWWPFPHLPGRTVLFIIVWPLLVHWVLTLLARRRNRRR